MEIMIVDARDYVGKTFPTDEGARLADALLAQSGLAWEDLEVNVAHLPPSLLISAFFNAFLHRVSEKKPALLNKARGVKWHARFPFQQANIDLWLERYDPQP